MIKKFENFTHSKNNQEIQEIAIVSLVDLIDSGYDVSVAFGNIYISKEGQENDSFEFKDVKYLIENLVDYLFSLYSNIRIHYLTAILETKEDYYTVHYDGDIFEDVWETELGKINPDNVFIQSIAIYIEL